MLRRSVAQLFALAIFALTADAAAGSSSPVRLHLADDSTCEGVRALPSRLAAKGLAVVADGDANETSRELVDVDVRALTIPGGADAQLVIRRGGRTATRSLTAPTCDEVLDAVAFALALALDEAEEPAEAPAVVVPSSSRAPAPPTAEAPAPPPPRAPVVPSLVWGGGAGAGVFGGASPSAALVVVVHAELESRAPRLVAPALVLGAAFVLPTSTTASGSEISFALQTGMVDGCPLRFGGDRFALRPCFEVQIGRLQSRSSGFAGAQLESTSWVALALAARGRLEIGAGLSLEADLSAGSPLIQDAFSVGNQRVFGVGPLLLSATAGVAVHFP
jgi:hypothetical protein